jgi:tetratricopeptide (TPR) repeat protein
MTPRVLVAALFGLTLAVAPPALSQERLDVQLDGLARAWAHVNYEISDPRAEVQAARKLEADAEAVARQNPTRAEPLAWQALALLCEADARHNLSSLELAGQARHLLEKAARIDPNAIGPGVIYANLGSLYAQLPGFPLSFGDKGKAHAYFEKALAANPEGLDTNYFYGDFLYRQGLVSKAVQVLEKALAAPLRPARALADRGRKWEATQLLARIQAKEKLSDASDPHRKPA